MKPFSVLFAVLGVATLITAAPAAALVDTPDHLMVKGLETNALLSGGRWLARCTPWKLESSVSAWSRCWRLHKRRGHGYRSDFYNGSGALMLKQEYSLTYWSFRYKITVIERGCNPENPYYEEELRRAEEIEREREEPVARPPKYWGCTSVEKREWSPWRLIFLH